LTIEETHSEDSIIEERVSAPTTEELHPTEVVDEDVVIPKESISVETVKTEECAAELSIQPPTSVEEAEAESSISLPQGEEKAMIVELESATPEISASLETVEPATLEETVTQPSDDLQKPAELKQVEISVPRSEVEEDVSLTVANKPTTEDLHVEDSLMISSAKPEEKESTSLDSKREEPETADESLSLTIPKHDESVSLALRQPQEEGDSELTLSLKKPEDGMTPARQR